MSLGSSFLPMPGGEEGADSEKPHSLATRHWCHTDRQWHRRCNDSQGGMSSLTNGGWGARMGWTPTFSVAPNLKMEWNCRFQLWHAHTHAYTHACTHPQTDMSLNSQSWVCVTQFGLCVRGSSAFGSSYLLLPCFLSDSFPFFCKLKKKAHQSVAETKPKDLGIFFTSLPPSLPHTYRPGSQNKILFGSRLGVLRKKAQVITVTLHIQLQGPVFDLMTLHYDQLQNSHSSIKYASWKSKYRGTAGIRHRCLTTSTRRLYALWGMLREVCCWRNACFCLSECNQCS